MAPSFPEADTICGGTGFMRLIYKPTANLNRKGIAVQAPGMHE
jgi:hypothetical protein